MKLIPDARRSWRLFSMQLAAVAAVLPQAWAAMPEDLKAWVPEEWRPHVVSAVAVAIIIGRLIDQGGRDA